MVAASLLAASAGAQTTMTLPGFHTPTGNIRCFASLADSAPATLHCQIGQADYSAQLQARCLQPDGSGVDWHGFELGARSRGLVSCSGGILYSPDTQHPLYANLPYGKTWRHAPFACASRLSGVTCTNGHGHGLFVSRQSFRTW
jgi:hypothetical protein